MTSEFLILQLEKNFLPNFIKGHLNASLIKFGKITINYFSLLIVHCNNNL